jgi:hypothetical protein
VSFAAITLCVASQRVFIVVVYFVMTQSGNFWIHPRIFLNREVIVANIDKKLPIFFWETRGSLPCSQEPSSLV